MFLISVFLLIVRSMINFLFFFFNDTATTEIYTLSLHDALPIFLALLSDRGRSADAAGASLCSSAGIGLASLYEIGRHTSELQSQSNLVCRLLLEKKKNRQGHRRLLPIPHARYPLRLPVTSSHLL